MSKSQENKQLTESRRTRSVSSFTETANKKNRNNKVAQRTLVPVQEKEEVSDSDGGNQPEYGYVAIVIKPRNYVSP